MHPKFLFGVILCVQPPAFMTPFARKTISKRCDWCKISKCYDMTGARYIPLCGNLIRARYIPKCGDLIGASNIPLCALTWSYFYFFPGE